MYVEDIIFYNRAPFENLHLKFDAPGVSLLTGVNGKGKTTILSYIVDAFYEMARDVFSSSFVGKENKLYRLSSFTYVMDSSKPSIVYIRFRDGNNNYDYIDVNSNGEFDDTSYNEAIPFIDKINHDKINSVLNSSRFARILSDSLTEKMVRQFFHTQLFTYFPSYRYEIPGYLNEPYRPHLSENNKFTNQLDNPITVQTSIESLSSWLLDVILDQNVYKDTANGEKTLWNNINTILRDAMSSKKLEGYVRIGIGRRGRGSQRVSVVQDIGDEIKIVAPNLHDLSSGEAGILEVFGEILRQGDNLHNNISLHEITGIVLIDEIDKNLHIKLQKEVLPKLLFAFPRIQFIITSHSPFLNMGLDNEKYGEKAAIYDLDNNGLKTTPTNCDIYEDVYKMFTHDNSELIKQLDDLKTTLKTLQKTLVLTEGKTDIIFINKAKKELGIDIEYDTVPSDKQPDGDSSLYKLLQQFALLPNTHKIIGIFDRDNDDIIKKLKPDEGKCYKSFGNNVYGFCLPIPTCRVVNNQNKISIEYLFTDSEIKTPLDNGCRLFFGTEFTGNSMWHNVNKNLTLKTPNDKGKDKIIENTGGQAVYDQKENNHLAKKSDFAEAVRDDKISISNASWDNFRAIFEIIGEIIENK